MAVRDGSPHGRLKSFDLLVVGAGPAGVAAALAALAARPDARVCLFDRATFPRDKTCGDGLTAASVRALRRLDAAAALDGFDTIKSVVVSSPRGRRATLRTREAFVVPRRVLDARLVDIAVARGAKLLTERITHIENARDQVILNGRYAAPYAIGADGANSVTRPRITGSHQPHEHIALAMRGYATVPPGDPRLQFDVLRSWKRAYAWLFTDGSGMANVGCCVFERLCSLTRETLAEAIAEQFPRIGVDESTLRAHKLPLSSMRPSPGVGRVLLAGDAAALIDPLTGEGIHTALVSGALAGNAVMRASEPGRAYTQWLEQAFGRYFEIAARSTRIMRGPVLVEVAVALSRALALLTRNRRSPG